MAIKYDDHDKDYIKFIIGKERIKGYIFLHDISCKLGFRQGGMIGAALYKGISKKPVIINLSKFGWKYKKLPKNQYI